MPDQKLKLNILNFENPVDEIECGFYKEKIESYAPLHKAEYPKILWEEHEDELKDISYLYTNFETTKDCDYKATVQLASSAKFSAHYYKHQIRKHFLTIADVAQYDFVGDVEVWFRDSKLSTSKYDTFQIFSLRVQFKRVSDSPELLVSYDGTTKVLNKSLKELKNFPTEKLNKVVYNKAVYKYEYLSPEIKQNHDQIFPKLSNELKTFLEIPWDKPKFGTKYKDYFQKIRGFYNKYLNTSGFKSIIPFQEGFIDMPPKRILRTKYDSNNLEFGNEEVGIDPKAFIDKGPYSPPHGGHCKFFFIYPKSERLGKVKSLYQYLTEGYTYNGYTFPAMDEVLRQNFEMLENKSVAFDSIDTVLDQTREFLKDFEAVPNTRYLAIYVSPISKDNPDPEKRLVYARLKEMLLKNEPGITSQVIYKGNIGKPKYNFHLTNISSALLAKLDGIPWRLKREPKDELVVGVGAFYSYTDKCRYVGSAFCFNNEGDFQGFKCFSANQTKMLAGSIREAVLKYMVEHENTKRLIIHFYKKMSERELEPIVEMLEKLNVNIPVYVITINKTEEKDLVAFNMQHESMLPLSGTILPIGRDQYLLFNNTRYQINSRISDWPFPIKLTFSASESNLLNDDETIKELIDQVYQFSRMYWKSVKQQNLPVTIKYPEMVAEVFPYFKSDKVPEFGENNLWFL
ncbi:Piwi domain-containing protein [Salibacter halophilus]|uniref:Protein argonaute n=1 Tax=Salibacter halophilus TaxID=1803916 RepID=A0A6N6MA58_9FLAO|nr:Piwi domain-containing protein [Salibacter halophilus]KAB1065130.1 hypothetical protein F3059_04040 [Salibacter halophilus]